MYHGAYHDTLDFTEYPRITMVSFLEQNMYYIKIKDEVVHKTDSMKKALKIVTKIFRDGHKEVYLHGGRIGKWWKG